MRQMLTAIELQERLSWPHVDETIQAEYHLIYLYIRPTAADLAPIYICMDDTRDFVQQFGFGEWHYHPDEIDAAVETARSLVRGEQCVVEQRDANGKYVGSVLLPPDGVPDGLVSRAASLRRVFFNRPPIEEAFDFTRYFQGKHSWITHARKDEFARLHRKLGIAEPEW
jgi:hypothetical protein